MHALLTQGEGAAVQQACHGGQERSVHSDEVTEGPDLLQGQLLNAVGGRDL